MDLSPRLRRHAYRYRADFGQWPHLERPAAPSATAARLLPPALRLPRHRWRARQPGERCSQRQLVWQQEPPRLINRTPWRPSPNSKPSRTAGSSFPCCIFPISRSPPVVTSFAGDEDTYANNNIQYIPASLQKCASPGFFYTANSPTDITAALNAMFNHALQTAHITNVSRGRARSPGPPTTAWALPSRPNSTLPLLAALLQHSLAG